MIKLLKICFLLCIFLSLKERFLFLSLSFSLSIFLFIFVFFFYLLYWCAHRRVCRESFQMPDMTIYGLDVRVTRSGREFWNLWPVVRAVYQLGLPFKFPIDCSIDAAAAATLAARRISSLELLFKQSRLKVYNNNTSHSHLVFYQFTCLKNFNGICVWEQIYWTLRTDSIEVVKSRKVKCWVILKLIGSSLM